MVTRRTIISSWPELDITCAFSCKVSMLTRSRKGTESEELHAPCLWCKQSTVGKEQCSHSTAILSLIDFLLGTVWGGRIRSEKLTMDVLRTWVDDLLGPPNTRLAISA